MTDPSLYDEDILLWSEQQADAIRRLGQTRHDVSNVDLSNVLDVENVAEEIESVGRSELAAVESYIQLIMVHLIKLVVEAHSDTEPHWESEIFAFHTDMVRHYAPSMRQRLDIDAIWRLARKQSLLAYRRTSSRMDLIAGLPMESPLLLHELLAPEIDVVELVGRLRQPDASRLSEEPQ